MGCHLPSAAAGGLLTGQDALLATGNRTFIQPWSSGVGNEAFFALVFRCDSTYACRMQ